MNNLDSKNQDIIKRGKSIRTLIRELAGVSNPEIEVRAAIDEQLFFIDRIVAEDEVCVIYCTDMASNMLSKITVREIIKSFLKFDDWDTEVKLSTETQDTKLNIGLVGRKSGCMVLFHFEDEN